MGLQPFVNGCFGVVACCRAATQNALPAIESDGLGEQQPHAAMVPGPANALRPILSQGFSEFCRAGRGWRPQGRQVGVGEARALASAAAPGYCEG